METTPAQGRGIPKPAEHFEERPSATEFRRRKVLEPVLKACADLGVEALVLPEYTVRAETVRWLAEHRPRLAKETSIWAGTYKVPFGGSAFEPANRHRVAMPSDPQHSALLTVLPASRPRTSGQPPADPTAAAMRAKRYPAISIR
ncbi:MAG: hypothetical protein AAGM22_13375 [Acidobacteriota bacterium]